MYKAHIMSIDIGPDSKKKSFSKPIPKYVCKYTYQASSMKVTKAFFTSGFLSVVKFNMFTKNCFNNWGDLCSKISWILFKSSTFSGQLWDIAAELNHCTT